MGDPAVTCRLYVAGRLVDTRTCAGLDGVAAIADAQAAIVARTGDPPRPYLVELDIGDGAPVRFGTDPAGMVLPIAVDDADALLWLADKLWP